MAGLSLLRVVSNDELSRMEAEQTARALEERQQQPMVLGIVAYVRRCWDAARIAKKPIEDRMLANMRQRKGEYEASKLSEIRKAGGSDVFMLLTEVKCRGAESWLRDVLMENGTPPWDLTPTPIPDLPPGVADRLVEMVGQRALESLQETGRAPTPEQIEEMREIAQQEIRLRLLQEAQNRADKMKYRIGDQFAQGGWARAVNEFITDFVTHPAAILKGPVVRRQRRLRWVSQPGGQFGAEVEEVLAPEFDRVDPFRFYPQPGIGDVQEGYCFEVHKLSRADLADLIGVPGYDEDAIRAILMMDTDQSWFDVEDDPGKESLENKFNTHFSTEVEFWAMEFWGKVSGRMLREWGLSEEEVPDEAREYDANVWIVANYAIKVVLNYDPLGEKPYSVSSMVKVPGAMWGKGLPEVIEDIQAICNAAARALVNNMGISSGPQVEVNIDRLPPEEEITKMYPWKIWQVLNDPAGSSAPALRFNQPDSRATELMAVYDKFSRLADDHSGIPGYVYGDLDVQGAGRTSSGLSMLMGAAGKAIRQIVGYIDADVIHPVVRRQFIYNMRFDPDPTIKGDAEVVPKGAATLAVRETVNMRRLEFLQMTANPVDSQIIGVGGRAALLREVAKGLSMDIDEIVPSRDKLALQGRLQMAAEAMAEQAAPADASDPPGAQNAAGAPAGGREANTMSPRMPQ
jgi:hypothetical protein